jgi:hypothetical protein
VVEVSQPPNGGTLIRDDGLVTYVPRPGFVGGDKFTYTITDGAGGYDTATVSVTVAAQTEPGLQDDSAVTVEGVPVQIRVLDNDGDGPLAVTGVGRPGHGKAQLNRDGTITYSPRRGFTGTDEFSYTVVDGNRGSDSARVTVRVRPRTAPEPRDDAATTFQDTPVRVGVLKNDRDPNGDPLTVTSVTQPDRGSAAIDRDGTIVYTPEDGFTGTDKFGYSVTDGRRGVGNATVVIAVLPRTAPEAKDDVATTQQGARVTIPVLRNDSDPNGDRLAITSATRPARGKVVVDGSRFIVYTPRLGFIGNDTFAYTVTDGNRGFSTATVTVTVQPRPEPEPDPNQAPTAHPVSLFLDDGTLTAVTVTGTGFDTGADPTSSGELQCDPPSQPAHGSVNAIGCQFTYQPPAGGFSETTSFTYTVTDAGTPPLTSAPATVTLQLRAGPVDPGGGLPGDIDFNGQVDGIDLEILRANFNKSNPTFRDGDLDRDGRIGPADIIILNQNMGRQRLPADANRDGQVGSLDFVTLAQNFGKHNASLRHGDFDGDRKVGFSDFVMLANNYGRRTALGDEVFARLARAGEMDDAEQLDKVDDPAAWEPEVVDRALI